MPQTLGSGIPIVAIVALVILAALAVVIWAWRSPGSMDSPWVAVSVGSAIFVLAVAIWPVFPLLLVIAIPVALIALIAFFFLPRRPAS